MRKRRSGAGSSGGAAGRTRIHKRAVRSDGTEAEGRARPDLGEISQPIG